jgi:hypothetical protein
LVGAADWGMILAQGYRNTQMARAWMRLTVKAMTGLLFLMWHIDQKTFNFNKNYDI